MIQILYTKISTSEYELIYAVNDELTLQAVGSVKSVEAVTLSVG